MRVKMDKSDALERLNKLKELAAQVSADIGSWNFSYTSGITYTSINRLHHEFNIIRKMIDDTIDEIEQAKPRRFCKWQDVDECGQYCLAGIGQREVKECPYEPNEVKDNCQEYESITKDDVNGISIWYSK